MTPLLRVVIAVGALLPAACALDSAPPARAPMATRPVEPAAPPSVAQAPAPGTPPAAKAPPPPQASAAPAKPNPPASAAAAPAKPRPPASAATAPAKPQAPAPLASAPAPLDLQSLEKRLKDTSAIGVLTKLSLKNQVDDLIGRFRAYHQGARPPTLTDLRPAFDLLLMKVLSLLQDHDPGLARDINASRDAIWAVLTDPRKLAQFA